MKPVAKAGLACALTLCSVAERVFFKFLTSTLPQFGVVLSVLIPLVISPCMFLLAGISYLIGKPPTIPSGQRSTETSNSSITSQQGCDADVPLLLQGVASDGDMSSSTGFLTPTAAPNARHVLECKHSTLRREHSNYWKAVIRFPLKHYLFMSSLDALQGILLIIPGGYVPAPLTVMLLQLTIPLTMIFTRLLLGTRFSPWQIVGASATAAGVIATCVSQLMEGEQQLDFDSKLVIYTLLYAIANIPGALSGIYKEWALQGQPMDLFYLNGMIALAQAGLSIAVSPLSYKIQTSSSLSSLPSDVSAGLQCLFVRQGCPWIGPPFFWTYVFVALVFNATLCLVILHCSAVAMFISLAMTVPIVFTLFSSHEVMAVAGLPASPFGCVDGLGLAITAAGMVAYFFAPEENDDKDGL